MWMQANACRQHFSLDRARLRLRVLHKTPSPSLRSTQDLFQKNFWKLRAAEYQPYTLQLSPIITKQVGRGRAGVVRHVLHSQA